MSISEEAAARSLMSAAAVRERCGQVLAAGRADRLGHFRVDMERLHLAADYVADTVRANYPKLDVPPHARWRHFVVGGVDRWNALAPQVKGGAAERARTRFDLAVTSVLLDAGAGAEWRWRDRTSGTTLVRSEGLALASLELFETGGMSSSAANRLQADAAGLKGLSAVALAAAFQVSESNPLIGVESRAALINRVGEAIAARPDLFGPTARIGGLYDTLVARANGGAIAAPDILALVLEALGSIWPGRIVLGGVNLGDTWRHPAVKAEGPTTGLVPFHKLSQWLSYSLIEPLQEAGHTVSRIDGLTGLAEYRNGGLFIDLDVIVPRTPDLLAKAWTPAEEPIVEWRALTVALLDEIAPLVRARLQRSPEQMPLAAVLEGGTWSAGRRIAKEKRADGGPPVRIVSDGSVF